MSANSKGRARPHTPKPRAPRAKVEKAPEHECKICLDTGLLYKVSPNNDKIEIPCHSCRRGLIKKQDMERGVSASGRIVSAGPRPATFRRVHQNNQLGSLYEEAMKDDAPTSDSTVVTTYVALDGSEYTLYLDDSVVRRSAKTGARSSLTRHTLEALIEMDQLQREIEQDQRRQRVERGEQGLKVRETDGAGVIHYYDGQRAIEETIAKMPSSEKRSLIKKMFGG